MRTFYLLLLCSIHFPTIGQQNNLQGTIWKTEPRFIPSHNDSCYLALAFKGNYVSFYTKWKKLARVDDYDEMPYKTSGKTVSMRPLKRKTEFYTGVVNDSEILLTQHILNTQGIRVEQNAKFYLSEENTLNGTKWMSTSFRVSGDHYKPCRIVLSFTESKVYMEVYEKSDKTTPPTVCGTYHLEGDKIIMNDEKSNIGVISHNRKSFVLLRSFGGNDQLQETYTKLN